MTRRKIHKTGFWGMAALAGSAFIIIGCAHEAPKSADSPPERAATEAGAQPESLRTLKGALGNCKADFGKEAAEHKILKEEVAGLKLLLLEKDIQIKGFEKRLGSLQNKLDETIQEVVRDKAKLRSLDSKAEAASNMAETEISLKVLRGQASDAEIDADLAHAEHLLMRSTQEFKKENYGGALYLADQARNHMRMTQIRHAGRDKLEPVSGEILFSLPIPLKVTRSSNLRQGPGLDFKVIATLKPQTLLVGYSYKGQWVRVKNQDGRTGWVFQTLVGGR
jgi:hypothetical protein